MVNAHAKFMDDAKQKVNKSLLQGNFLSTIEENPQEEDLEVHDKEQNIGNYGYIGTWILRKYWKYRKISVDILTKISVMQNLTKIL